MGTSRATRPRHEVRRDRAIHEDGLDRVAHTRPLDLRVRDDRGRAFLICGGVDVDVTDALVVLDHRDARVLGDEADEPLAAARDAQVDQLVEHDELRDRFTIGDRYELDGFGRQLRGGEPGLHRAKQRAIGLERLAAAAQDARVAGLEAQRGGIGRDVGPRLVDHRDHAERDPHARDLETVRANLGALDSPE